MSVATSRPPGGGVPAALPAPAPSGEACPLCGAPLHPEQEWCLRCGAAARTRLAASPRWKGPIVTLAVVVALSLAVLAAALVKLAGGSGTATTTTTVTTRSAAAIAPTTTTTLRGATTRSSAAGALSGLQLTSPRGRKSKRGRLGLGLKSEERLRKIGPLSGPDTR